MAGSTNIEWTDCTWNPTVGCTVCAAGCKNCYAMRMAARMEAMGVPHYAGTTRKVNGKAVWTGKIAVAPDHILTEPLRWKKPRRIFVNSMSDLFHPDVRDVVIDRVFAVMALCPQHVFQVLTKRPARMRAYMDRLAAMLNNGWGVFLASPIAEATRQVSRQARHPFWMNAPLEWCDNSENARENPGVVRQTVGFPPRNVWLGTSVSTQADANANIPDLLATPAAVRFVSVEPMLGPVDVDRWLHPRQKPNADGYDGDHAPGWTTDINRVDWIICGGESGPGARPMHPDWVRFLRDQCRDAGVPFFMKQIDKKQPIPDDLMVREWPVSPQRTNQEEKT